MNVLVPAVLDYISASTLDEQFSFTLAASALHSLGDQSITDEARAFTAFTFGKSLVVRRLRKKIVVDYGVSEGLKATPPQGVQDEHLEAWKLLVHEHGSPIIRARAAEMLIQYRVQPVLSWTEVAISNWIETSRQEVRRKNAVLAVGRALTLAITRSLDRKNLKIVTGIESIFGTGDNFADNALFVELDVMAIVMSRLPQFDPDLQPRVERVVREFKRAAGQLPVTENVLEPLLRLAEDDVERVQVRARHVKFLILAGNESRDSFGRAQYYSQALKAATQYSLGDLKTEATVLLQRAAREPKEWSRIELKAEVPAVFLRAEVERVLYTDSWRHAILTWITGTPPAGTNESNRTSAAMAAKAGPITRLITRVEYSTAGYPVKTISDDTDHADYDYRKSQEYALALSGSIAAYSLQGIRSFFGTIDTSSIQGFLVSEFKCDRDAARSFAKGLECFWAKDYSAAVHVTIFEIERLLRSLLILLDQAVFKAEVGSKPGQFPSLDFYITAVESLGYDEDWISSIRALLCSQGLNLRNEYAHGLRNEFGNVEAANVIRTLGSVILSAPRFASAIEVSAEFIGGHLTSSGLGSRPRTAVRPSVGTLSRARRSHY